MGTVGNGAITIGVTAKTIGAVTIGARIAQMIGAVTIGAKIGPMIGVPIIAAKISQKKT
jgi:hypothetical protein